MPGVPSGKACDGCRKQKKKCDQKNPCSRCVRLSLKCVGAGKQRYVFRIQSSFSDSSSSGSSSSSSPSRAPAATDRKLFHNHSTSPAQPTLFWQQWNAMGKFLWIPANSSNKLLASFVNTIQPSMDICYNLGWTYGSFYYDIPQRLGISKPLDTAVATLISAHGETCRSERELSATTLVKYSDALSSLRICLNDPVEACKAETLCAVSVLLTCQNLIGTYGQQGVTHCEGAAQILQARGFIYNLKDELERKLLFTLRGSLLFDGIFNDKVTRIFLSEKWQRLAENELDGTTSEGQIMHYIAQIPDLVRRGRDSRQTGIADKNIAEEIRTRYKMLRTVLKKVKACYDEVEPSHVQKGQSAVHLHAYYQRFYGICLMFTILTNMLLRAALIYTTELDPAFSPNPRQGPVTDLNDMAALISEVNHYSECICILASQAHQYRPLGASYVVTCLMFAYMGVDDPEKQDDIHLILEDFRTDFPNQTKITKEALGWMKRRLQFEDIDTTAHYGSLPYLA